MNPKEFSKYTIEFRFENKFFVEPNLDDVVITDSDNAISGSVVHKLDSVCTGLDEWGKNLAHRFKEDIAQYEKEMN